MRSFKFDRVPPKNPTDSATTAIIAGPISVEEYRTLVIEINNCSTSVTVTELFAESAFQERPTTDEAPSWTLVDPTDLPIPDTMGVSTSYQTIVSDSAWRYLRFKGRTSNSATAGTVLISVGGRL